MDGFSFVKVVSCRRCGFGFGRDVSGVGGIFYLFIIVIVDIQRIDHRVVVMYVYVQCTDHRVIVVWACVRCIDLRVNFRARDIFLSFCLFSPCVLNTSTRCLHNIFRRGFLVIVVVGCKGYAFTDRGDCGFRLAFVSLGERAKLRDHLSKSFCKLLGNTLGNDLGCFGGHCGGNLDIFLSYLTYA